MLLYAAICSPVKPYMVSCTVMYRRKQLKNSQCRSAGKRSSAWRMERGTETNNGIGRVLTICKALCSASEILIPHHIHWSGIYSHSPLTDKEMEIQRRKRRLREVKYLAWGHTAEPRFKPGPVLCKLLIVAALESDGQRLIAQRVVPTYKNVRKGMTQMS